VSDRLLGRLGDAVVALPALVLEFDRLEGDRVGVGVEVGERLVLGDPAAQQLVGERGLAGLVVDLDDDVLAEVLERASAPRPAPKFQTLAAQRSKSRSWVTPRSRVTASNSVRPGDLRDELGSPPSRWRTTSVVRLRPLTLLMPAT
jgi:hypothetical protein